MKKFEFSMQKILDLKNNILEEEKNRLGRLQEEKRKIELRIEALQTASREISEEMKRAQLEGVTVAALLASSARQNIIRLQMEDMLRQLETAQEKVDAQMQVVVAASQEVSKLEKVEERQYEIYRGFEKKAEATRIEELVTNNISRRQVV